MIESELFRNLFESMTIPAYIVDADLRLVYANHLAIDFNEETGGGKNAVEGKDLWEVAPYLPGRLRETYRQVIETGRGSWEELTIEYLGKTVYANVRRFPIYTDQQVTHVGVIFENITELRRTQEALRQSEEIGRALINASVESIFLIRDDECILEANVTGAARLGLTVAEIRGKHMCDVMDGETLTTRRKYLERIRQSGESVRFTDRRGDRVFDTTMAPLPNPEGGAVLVAVFARDISDIEYALKALGESEYRFRSLFEYNPVASYVWRWDGTALVLRGSNTEAHHITDGAIDAALGTTAEDMYATSYPEILSDLQKCFSTRTRVVREMQYQMMCSGKAKYLEVHYVFVPPDEVLVHTVDLTARREAELALQKSYAEMERRVVERTRELADLNEQLRLEREALNQKNIAMRELIDQITDSKKTLANHIEANLRHVAFPILERLAGRVDDAGKNYLQMLKTGLDDILSPHLTELQTNHPHLTAHEIDLCNLIRSGFSCKEIAEMRGRSEQTILKQRKVIRRKLGLIDERVNLRNYLLSVKTSSQTI